MIQSLTTGKRFNIRTVSKYLGQTVAVVTLDWKKKNEDGSNCIVSNLKNTYIFYAHK